jgi:hypothetical protein
MVKRAAIFALQPYTAYAFTANGVLTKRRDAPAAVAPVDGALCPRCCPFALFLWPEVRIDLHPDEKRAWILQID